MKPSGEVGNSVRKTWDISPFFRFLILTRFVDFHAFSAFLDIFSVLLGNKPDLVRLLLFFNQIFSCTQSCCQLCSRLFFSVFSPLIAVTGRFSCDLPTGFAFFPLGGGEVSKANYTPGYISIQTGQEWCPIIQASIARSTVQGDIQGAVVFCLCYLFECRVFSRAGIQASPGELAPESVLPGLTICQKMAKDHQVFRL